MSFRIHASLSIVGHCILDVSVERTSACCELPVAVTDWNRERDRIPRKAAEFGPKSSAASCRARIAGGSTGRRDQKAFAERNSLARTIASSALVKTTRSKIRTTGMARRCRSRTCPFSFIGSKPRSAKSACSKPQNSAHWVRAFWVGWRVHADNCDQPFQRATLPGRVDPVSAFAGISAIHWLTNMSLKSSMNEAWRWMPVASGAGCRPIHRS